MTAARPRRRRLDGVAVDAARDDGGELEQVAVEDRQEHRRLTRGERVADLPQRRVCRSGRVGEVGAPAGRPVQPHAGGDHRPLVVAPGMRVDLAAQVDVVVHEPALRPEAALRPGIGALRPRQVRRRPRPLVEPEREQRRVRRRHRIAVAVGSLTRPEDPARARVGGVHVPAVLDQAEEIARRRVMPARRRCCSSRRAPGRSRGCRRCRPRRSRRTPGRTRPAGRARGGCRRQARGSARAGRRGHRGPPWGSRRCRASPRAPARTARPARDSAAGAPPRTTRRPASRSTAASPSTHRCARERATPFVMSRAGSPPAASKSARAATSSETTPFRLTVARVAGS